MKIVPAVLAETFDDLISRLRQAESFTDYVQVDVMDGTFVNSTSFPPDMLHAVDTSLSFEAHLMVEDPMDFIPRLDNDGLKKVIFHCESRGDLPEVISAIRKRGLAVGIAIRPDTEIDAFREIAVQADTLLFLTVDPGSYGGAFRPEVARKVADCRRIFPDKTLSVDGGVSLENLGMFYTIGVDYVCVGSRIFLQDNPAIQYGLFMRRLAELEGGNS